TFGSGRLQPRTTTMQTLAPATIRQGQHKTQALAIVNTIISSDNVKVILQNVSDKNINGIQLAVNGARCQIEFLDADEPNHKVLAPKAIYEQWFPLNNSRALEVTILAVTFEDKTSEGDPELITEIKETRQGARKQLMRLLLILNDTLNSLNADSSISLDRLESNFRASPDDDGISDNIRLGEHKAKGMVLNYIQTLKHTQQTKGMVNIRQALTDLKNRLDSNLNKFN